MIAPTPSLHSYPRRRWVVPAIVVGLAAALSAGLMARTLRSYPGPVVRTATPDARASAPSPTPPVVLQFSLAVHSGTGPMEDSKATDVRRLLPGERGTVAFEAGLTRRQDACLVGSLNTGEAPRGFLSWSADAAVTRVDGERVDVQVSWRRLDAGGTVVASGTKSITLRDGQAHLLDLVDVGPPHPARCEYLALQVTATIAPLDPDARLAYQFWLVLDHDGTRLTAGPVEVLGPPGQPVPFQLRPIRWPLVGLGTPPAGGPTLDLEVQGRVTGTLTTPDTVRASLDVTRDVRLGGATTGGGTLPVHARLGEPVTVGIPTPTGRSQVTAPGVEGDVNLPRGVTRTGAAWEVHYAEYFTGSALTLVLVTERVR